jgi:ABC-type uncharacterized transport system fused permease/ATPase subunit
MVTEKLPDTTIVSISHAGALQFHQRHLKMQSSGPGIFTPAEVELKAAE